MRLGNGTTPKCSYVCRLRGAAMRQSCIRSIILKKKKDGEKPPCTDRHRTGPASSLCVRCLYLVLRTFGIIRGDEEFTSPWKLPAAPQSRSSQTRSNLVLSCRVTARRRNFPMSSLCICGSDTPAVLHRPNGSVTSHIPPPPFASMSGQHKFLRGAYFEDSGLRLRVKGEWEFGQSLQPRFNGFP